jgi:guanine deaminase
MTTAKSFWTAFASALTLIIPLFLFSPTARAGELTGVRGCFFDFTDDPWKFVGKEEQSARFYPDGLLVVDDGIIKAYGPYDKVSAKYPNLKITNLTNRLILPGFIDGHIHVGQTRVLGAYGQQLLPWLLDWIFPEEAKYKDPAYAREGTKRFFDNLLAAGTTTCQAFTTNFPVSVEAFFDEAARRNMRVIGGLTGMDTHCPDDMKTPPDMFYAESKRLIEKYHRKGRNLYAIEPRFAYGCSPALMAACQKLKQEYPDTWVQTHVSENPTETRNAPLGFENCPDYLSVYEKYGLVGPKFSGGHGVWLSNQEMDRMAKAGAAISFCPISNLFLGSGLFRIGKATDPNHRVRLNFGTDMGGGDRFSMIDVLDEGYKVGMCNNTMLDGSVDPRWQNESEAERNKLNAYRAFYSITLGGAHGLYLDDLIGNFSPGKEADFVALDWNGGPPATKWHQSLIDKDKTPTTKEQAANLLFGIMTVGDERAVDETWVMGHRAYKRGAETGIANEVSVKE